MDITHLDYLNTTMKKQFKLSDRLNAKFIIILRRRIKFKYFNYQKHKNKIQETIKESNY